MARARKAKTEEQGGTVLEPGQQTAEQMHATRRAAEAEARRTRTQDRLGQVKKKDG